MFEYPVTLTPDDGTVLVTFVDVPEVLALAVDALETGLSFYVETLQPLSAGYLQR